MQLIIKLLFFFFLLISNLNSEVLQVTSDTFEETINSSPYVFVKFYAPWCGHCKALAPKFESLSNNFPEDQDVKFVDVDASNERSIAAKYQISGYPTLKFFLNGEAIAYEGGREENDMKDWILKKLQPSVHDIDLSQLEQIKSENEVCVVLYEEASKKEFEFVGKQFDDIPFYFIKESGVSTPMVLYKQFDEKEAVFTDKDELSRENIFNFIEENQYRHLSEFNDKFTKRLLENSKLGLVAFVKNDELDEIMQQIENPIYSKGFILAIGKWSNDAAKRVGERTGLDESKLPVIRILKSKGRDLAKYAFEDYYEELNEANIIKFAEEFLDGKIKEWYKSEQVPENQGDVIKVVGKTFQEIIMDRDKDVLVKYYAPWCGHCKALSPIFENVAKQLKRNKDLLIAEFDYTANEVEGEGLPEVTGYPTIKFHTRKRKIGAIDFKGDRTEEGIIDFLRKKVTVPWKEPKSKPKKPQQEEL